jgi:sigma-E factor negative regulatory protein RseC
MPDAMPGGCDTGPGPGADPRTLSQRLRVVAVRADRLHLAADRAAGCASCSARKGCGVPALAEMSPAQVLMIPRPAGLTVAPGDEVELAMAGGAFLGAAALAYLLPAVALVATVSLCSAAGLTDAWSALAGLAALALSFLPVARADRRSALTGALEVRAVHPAARGTP